MVLRFPLSSPSPLIYFDSRFVLVSASLLSFSPLTTRPQVFSLFSGRFVLLGHQLLPNGKGFGEWGGMGDVAPIMVVVECLDFCLNGLDELLWQ